MWPNKDNTECKDLKAFLYLKCRAVHKQDQNGKVTNFKMETFNLVKK